MSNVARNRPLAAWALGAAGVWLVGLGAYFAFIRPPLLPEDLRFLGTTGPALKAALPALETWLGRVFTVMGGFIASTGVLTVFVASTAVPARHRGTSWVIAVAGVLGVAVMSATNFSLHSDFRWLLLAPVVAWIAALGLFVSRR